MKVIYATSIIYPSDLANRIQILEMSKSFSNILGRDFYLGVNRVNGIEGINNIVEFPQTKSIVLAFKYLRFIKRNKITHVYSREHKLLFFMMLYNFLFFRMNLKFCYESHYIPRRMDYFHKYVYRKSDHIVAISKFIKERMISLGVVGERVKVCHDGVSIVSFKPTLSKEDVLRKFNLPSDKKIVMYTGSFGHNHKWKGYDTVLDASLENDNLFVMVGGRPYEIENLAKKYSKVRFLGYVEHKLVSSLLGTADVLLLPNKSGYVESEYYTSPMKLFEYMTSGVPIIASDLPAIRDVLTEYNSSLIKPNQPDILSNQIDTVLEHYDLYLEKAKQAREDVLKYNWEDRAREISNFIK